MKTRGLAQLASIVLAFWSFTASAGSLQASEFRRDPAAVAAFAKQVEKAAAERGARVFLLARQGRPASELPAGIRYTHVAFAVYSMITTEDGRAVPGYAIYNLYQSSERPDTSSLVTDYPVDFFAAAFDLKTEIIIPTPVLQQRLLAVIPSEAYRRVHNPRYSVLSNPFDPTYQNCTEFVLNVLNAAIYGTDDMRQIKTNLRAYFEPQPVDVSPVKLMLGSLLKAEVALSDHEGPVKIATFTTIARYMEKHGLVEEAITLRATNVVRP